MDLNRVIIAGRLAEQVSLRITSANQSVATLIIETSRKYKDKLGQYQEAKSFFEVTVWGYQAENCSQFLNRGSNVLIEGRLQTRTWNDQGKERVAIEIVAENVQFGSRRQEDMEPKPPAEYGGSSYRAAPPVSTPPPQRPAPTSAAISQPAAVAAATIKVAEIQNDEPF